MPKTERTIIMPTDEEDAAINAGIVADPDTFEWTEADFKRAKPFAEVFPELAASIRKSRGRPPLADPKVAVKLRLDRAVVEQFKAGGPGWQTRINEALRKAVGM